jgi:hypothetical protein
MARITEHRQYASFVIRAWQKETLAQRIDQRIDPYPQSAIVSIEVGVDFQFWPFRRNWALVTVRRDIEDGEARAPQT